MRKSNWKAPEEDVPKETDDVELCIAAEAAGLREERLDEKNVGADVDGALGAGGGDAGVGALLAAAGFALA